MTIFVPTTPFGYTIFCDDVRQESNGKLFYIGVYQGDMIIHVQPPTMLPSFVAIVHYLERPGESGLPVKMKMFAPGAESTPIFEFDVPVEQMRSSPLPPDKEGEDKVLRASIPMKLAPFIVPSEGLIKIRAYRGDDEIRLGTLRVQFQTPPTAPVVPLA
jgi:hypothetical protein